MKHLADSRIPGHPEARVPLYSAAFHLYSATGRHAAPHTRAFRNNA